MLPIKSPETSKLARVLVPYQRRKTIAIAAGLLTLPHLQANTVRLQMLAHLAAAHCAGDQEPKPDDLALWLNDYLGRTDLA
ncbi:MAG: hypothetical protein WAN11_17435, partial [Syntrophobacteraceae bacterium]